VTLGDSALRLVRTCQRVVLNGPEMSVRNTQSATVGVLQTANLRSDSSDWIEMSCSALPTWIGSRVALATRKRSGHRL
jgi:hypothetical protein